MTPQKSALRLRQLLAALIVLLTVEGIVRKLAPSGLGVLIFLVKDVLVTVMAFYVIRIPPNKSIAFLWNAYLLVAVLFVPLILNTAWHDPVLAVFGAKQYLLFPMVGFATFYAFEQQRMDAILPFYRKVSLLIIPTAALALVQIRLPSDHWLNMSVNGESLAGFSAGGELRVSSSFSFVAQYCAFLNAQAFIILIALYDWKKQPLHWRVGGAFLLPLLVLSCFITGSRSSVAGDTSILLVAGALCFMKFKVRNVVQICLTVVALYFIAQAINYFSPDTTAAYSARENGKLIGISQEIQDRIFGSFSQIFYDKNLTTYFGNGIGIMSNGSDSFSSYAAMWREGGWEETDFSATLFEGGLYLGLIWYGFRIYIILATTLRFVQGLAENYTVPLAFAQGFLIVLGSVSGLGTQPPTAIWWWLSVGTSVLFWWKSIGPPEEGIPREEFIPPPKKVFRARSLYADVLHKQKAKPYAGSRSK